MDMFLYVDGGGFMDVLNVSKLTELYTLNECSCYSSTKLLKIKQKNQYPVPSLLFSQQLCYFVKDSQIYRFLPKANPHHCQHAGYFQLYPTSSLNSQYPGSKLLMPPPNKKQTFLFCISEDGDITQARNLDSSSHLTTHLYPLSVNSCLCSDLSWIPAFSCPVTLLEFLNT